jgi:hypothetical protein
MGFWTWWECTGLHREGHAAQEPGDRQPCPVAPLREEQAPAAPGQPLRKRSGSSGREDPWWPRLDRELGLEGGGEAASSAAHQ